VAETRRFVDIHAPDGKPDLLQQIEHGTLALLAQHRAVGHAIPGIIEPELSQYTHLGDASTKTDNRVFDPRLRADESDGKRSGVPDDRWAFTTHTTPLNYGSAAALAAASRALRGYDDALAEESLRTAKRVWEEEHGREPALFQFGNTTGGALEDEELKAAVELLLSTADARYRERIEALWPTIEKGFSRHAALAVRAMPRMGEAFAKKVETSARLYAAHADELALENPFGVPIATGGWAGSGQVVRFAFTAYALHKAFPEIVGKDVALRALGYVYGCHPGSDRSFVSAVGTESKTVAYGNNRADFSFIAGGIVPGVLILAPDFPENKEDWPFLWGENEYVIGVGADYILAVNAAIHLVRDEIPATAFPPP
jgi:endoglucanase